MDAPRPPESDATPEPPSSPPPAPAEVAKAQPAARPANTPPKARHRWPFVVVVFLVLFAVAYVMFFLWYQPLTATAGTSWVDPAYATNQGSFTSPLGEDFTQYQVRFADGERLRFMFTLTNTGGLPVTVQSVQLVAPGCEPCNDPLEQRSTSMLVHGPNENDPAHARDLQPFTLAGGDYRNIMITAKFVNCKKYLAGDIVTFSSVWVRTRAGMVPHETTIPLGYNLSVSRKGACSA